MAENRGALSELNLEVQQKTDRLAEVELRLKDCLAEKAQEEERLSRRLRDSHETIASLRAQSPPVKVSHQRAARSGALHKLRSVAPGPGWHAGAAVLVNRCQSPEESSSRCSLVPSLCESGPGPVR